MPTSYETGVYEFTVLETQTTLDQHELMSSVTPTTGNMIYLPTQTSQSSNLREIEELSQEFLDILTNRATSYEAGVHEFTVLEKQAILYQHNELRSSVTPTAGNMRYLTWDETLASHAGDWATQCNWWHETINGEGQNLWLGGSKPNAVQPVQAWYYNEVDNYKFELNTCYENKVCGHYFQVTWAKASKVGCVQAFCPEVTKKNDTHFWTSQNAWIFNCHYDVGVYKRIRPYIEDEPCAVCSEDYRKCMTGKLCRKPSQ
ncbi:GLIPR1-like protein 1 [Amphiura filiformis]|uniref:GLIPR1-like protein 1 n=1 Tax=Amphiura filiformis TaxID=82378 RepID=UPI003B22343C